MGIATRRETDRATEVVRSVTGRAEGGARGRDRERSRPDRRAARRHRGFRARARGAGLAAAARHLVARAAAADGAAAVFVGTGARAGRWRDDQPDPLKSLVIDQRTRPSTGPVRFRERRAVYFSRVIRLEVSSAGRPTAARRHRTGRPARSPAAARRCAWPRRGTSPRSLRIHSTAKPKSNLPVDHRLAAVVHLPALGGALADDVEHRLACRARRAGRRRWPSDRPCTTPAIAIWLTIFASWPAPLAPSSVHRAREGRGHRLDAIERRRVAAAHHGEHAVLRRRPGRPTPARR